MKLRVAFAACLSLLAGFQLAAQVNTFTWLSLAGQPYPAASNPANWVGGVAPSSSAQQTALVFSNAPASFVLFDTNLNALSLTFNGTYPNYQITPGVINGAPASLGLGAGGLTVTASSSKITFTTPLNLLADQTWNIAGNLAFPLGGITGNVALTKTGTGSLTLGSDRDYNVFSTVDVAAGTLFLSSSSTVDDKVYGPLGNATLTLRSGAKLASAAPGISLDNALSVFSGAIFGDVANAFELTLNGAITLQSSATTVTLSPNTLTQIFGGIGEATAATALTFTGGGLAVLGGANTYTGGTTANNAGIVFFNSSSLPATGSITSANNGYISVGFPTGMNALLGKITDPTKFNGSVGFETAPGAGAVTVYADSLNLAAFSPANFKGIGSFTSAILTGGITPVGAGNYLFGGGDGTVWVSSSLSASANAGLTVSAPLAFDSSRRFSLVLQGTNSFTGGVNVSGSNLIFDGAGALPAGPSISLGNGGYASFTDSATNVANFAAFTGRIAAGAAANAVVGIDSRAPATERTVADAIDLSKFGPLYFGTTSKIEVTGLITPPTGGMLFLAGINDGYLKVSSLITDPNVNTAQAVALGHASSKFAGVVELTKPNTYSGGTILASGHLVLGTSSTLAAGNTIASGPLGKGTLTVPNTANRPVLATSVSGVTLHNNISLQGPGLVVGGDPPLDVAPSRTGGFQDMMNSPVTAYAGHAITLNGLISDIGSLDFHGSNAQLTLGGNNTFSGGLIIRMNNTVIANTDTATGTGPVAIEDRSTLQFTTAAPSIGSLDGGGALLLAGGSSLQINQQKSGYFDGTITGTGVTLVKKGAADLHLDSSSSTYSGTTTINQGTLTVGGATPLGTSTVVLNGGSLLLAPGAYIANPITFTAPSRISGSGTFAAPFVAGTNATLAPGQSPGALSFANDLTFASGGAYDIEVQSTKGGPGVGYDTLLVNGSLIFSTPTTPFTLNLISLSTSGLLGTVSDFSSLSSYSWLIASASNGIFGLPTANVNINTNGFQNPLNQGVFSLSVGAASSGSGLFLNFTPVPEPSTWMMLLAGVGIVAIGLWRRRGSSGLN